MSLSRRTFLKGSLLTATATGVVGQSLLNAATLEKIHEQDRRFNGSLVFCYFLSNFEV